MKQTEVCLVLLKALACPCYTVAGGGDGKRTREEEKEKSESRGGRRGRKDRDKKQLTLCYNFILYKVLLDKLSHLILPRSLGESKK